MVLGKIGDWSPPFQVTFPQLAVIVAVLLLEYLTWGWWGTRLPVVLAVMVFIGLPCGLAWAARRARIEGRSLIRAARGMFTYLALAAQAITDGRRGGPSRTVVLDDAWMYLAQGDVPALPRMSRGGVAALPQPQLREGGPE